MERNDAFIPADATAELPSLTAQTLGECTIPNVYAAPEPFVDDCFAMLSPVLVRGSYVNDGIVEVAGPRRMIYFDPATTKVGIVTCGGLCPGLNNVIRGLVLNLSVRYGVSEIYGLKYGYEGLVAELSESVRLDAESVSDIHLRGGSVLGTSRGAQSHAKMADFLIANGFNILFCIGGDGTLKGCNQIIDELQRRGCRTVSVIGIPKTVDNDICYTDYTFGFHTAVQQAQGIIESMHYEVKSVKGGVGIVKLMGREAGFIALYAALASGDVNAVLIPEVPVDMAALCANVERRLAGPKGHCLLVVAEGAGQEHRPPTTLSERDKSGNVRFWDFCTYLRETLDIHLSSRSIEHTIKFVDPSYYIRSAVCVSVDSHLCLAFANAAVHTAMNGRTGVVICNHNNAFCSVPIARAIYYRKRVNPKGALYSMLHAIEKTAKPT